MNIGDIAATQHPVRSPNKLAQTMNDKKLEQIVKRKSDGKTKVMESAEIVRG